MKHGMRIAAAALLASSASIGLALAQDGTLQIYPAYPDEHMKALIESFNEKHPDVTVEVAVQPGEQLLSTIELEMRAGRPQADVVGLDQASIAYLQDRHGAFESYTPQGADGLRQEVRDASNTSAPACINLYLIQYSTNAVSADEAPESWADLTDPKWVDKIAFADPGSSQSIHSFIWFVNSYLGEDQGFGTP